MCDSGGSGSAAALLQLDRSGHFKVFFHTSLRRAGTDGLCRAAQSINRGIR